MAYKKLFWVITTITLGLLIFSGVAFAADRTYTLDSDFNEGNFIGVEHDTIHNQLQLSKQNVTLPFIWVPNNDNTVSKVDTITGKELGRYRVAPNVVDAEPSRTTIDLNGNCYVGNRSAGTVVKIGLVEVGEYVDRNGDGIIQTSQDLNVDGIIAGAEILPWGQDECVLFETVLIPGKEGVFVPGTYTGGYANDYWNPGPRSLAIDAQNNIWVGCYGTRKFHYIDGQTGTIKKTVDVYATGHTPYGAVIDKNGVIWSSSLGNHVLRLNPNVVPMEINKVDLKGAFSYGIGLDYSGHVITAGSNTITKIDIQTSDVTKFIKQEIGSASGVVCTSDNDIWVADTGGNRVVRLGNNGSFKATIPAGSAPKGVSVDSEGKVWVCGVGDEILRRINPTTNQIELTKQLVGSGGHYSYSDMTGIVARTISTKTGSWTVVNNGGTPDTAWNKVSWNSLEPTGTSIKVQVRSSNDKTNWSAWEKISNGVEFVTTPKGQYLQVETTLQIVSGEVSPILYDLTVGKKNLNGYMNGIGLVLSSKGEPITHAFVLRSNLAGSNTMYWGAFTLPSNFGGSNNFDITWGSYNKFQLTSLTEVSLIRETKNGVEGPYVISGTGVGKFKGVDGYKVKFAFSDGGDPGTKDFANILITNADGQEILAVSNQLIQGNYQIYLQK